MLELQRVNEALLIAAQQDDTSGKNTAKAQYSISADSAQLLGELRNRPRSYCPVSGLERPTVPLLPQPAPETCSLQVRAPAAVLLLPRHQIHCTLDPGILS